MISFFYVSELNSPEDISVIVDNQHIPRLNFGGSFIF